MTEGLFYKGGEIFRLFPNSTLILCDWLKYSNETVKIVGNESQKNKYSALQTCSLCACACIGMYIKQFCPYVIFMSHLPILQHSPCCCHQHFVFSTWLLPAFDSRDSEEDTAMKTQQQNRSV